MIIIYQNHVPRNASSHGKSKALFLLSFPGYTRYMSLSELSVYNVRSHELFSCQFDEHMTVILGKNGQGKTSLLESIYLLYRGTSFKGRDRDMISHDQTTSETKAVFSSSDERRARLSLSPDSKINKEFTINGKKSARLSPAQRLPIVLFDPEELRVLSGSPSRRREFFDGVIARLSPTYSTVLNRFTRTLAQRNELLKQYETMSHGAWESHMFAWDVKFVELATTIIKARANFIAHSNQHISKLYSELAGSEHIVSAASSAEFESIETTRQKILSTLQRNHQNDALRGYTSSGPQRDDIMISLDSHQAAETASRGELRTIMLAYKLLEIELQKDAFGTDPLILMDDVFSELDISREQQLLKVLEHHQTIITATDLRDKLKIDAKVINL